ncbi:recombinase RecA [Natronomonas salina]|uniref:RAD55 family ATPase n=1 Tax=Natronomonas salina TaxID=1710540 RepID=UPI0015B4EDFE|nr:RAD55 family ATPase [Natronomonas salina]QLD88366.1 recombinase RecA [Natronomonas salina]
MTPVESDGRLFCSASCAAGAERGEAPFAGAVDYKRTALGVDALSAGLPSGIPGNAAVLLAGEEGTRLQGLLQECVWRTLQRGQPAVVVSMDRPPSSLVDSFLTHDWNVLPYLDDGSLVVVDLFTKRLHDESAVTRRANRWNRHLQGVLQDAVAVVDEPSDVLEIANEVDGAVADAGLTESGLVAVDYLTELAAFAQEARATNLLRELRALVCKSRYVPMVAGASVGRFDDLYPTDFPHDHEYLFDGIVDLELDEDDDGTRRKRLSVRKMDDAPVDPLWFEYEFRPDAGFVASGSAIPIDYQ